MPALLFLALGLAAGPASALAPPTPDSLIETVLIGPAFLEPSLPLPPPVSAALARRDHAAALEGLKAIDPTSLKGHQVGDHAFLTAWVSLRLGKGAEAAKLLEVVRHADHVPADYLHLTLGELLLAREQPVEAATELALVPTLSFVGPRARLREADARQRAGSTALATTLWTELAVRPDPAEGTAAALLALARKSGLESPRAYPHLRRIWSQYPNSAEAGEAGRALAVLEARGAEHQATADELATRLLREMDADDYGDVIALYEKHAARFTEANGPSCKAWYSFGRSHFKRNNVSKAAEILVPAGTRCAGIDLDRGARSLYIAGKALERKKEWAAAGRAFAHIPELYPTHGMADDGAVLGGVAFQQAGESTRARALWRWEADREQHGDLAAEGMWRLAWDAYRSGQPEEAIRWAEKLTFEIPLSADPVHVGAGAYWAARWRLYPDVNEPRRLTRDPEALRQGVDQLITLCQSQPTSFYALLASGRVQELAPERAAGLRRPSPSGSPDTWTVRGAFLDDPGVSRGLALARLGLVVEAMSELDALPEESLTSSEYALLTTIQEKKNPIVAHDRLHHYIIDHPPSTLGVDRDRILSQGFPDLYWPEVQVAAGAYGYDPRVFHALVREESSFNKDIVSWAGAKGLSQLMPATGKQVAGWMGMKVTPATIFDPLTNLKIGSRYLEYLRVYFHDNMFLAVPAYNAGEGNVGKWLAGNGERPTDEYIESIPIRETRHYVKRVLGTYQLYRVLYGEGPVFPDWSHTNHRSAGRP